MFKQNTKQNTKLREQALFINQNTSFSKSLTFRAPNVKYALGDYFILRDTLKTLRNLGTCFKLILKNISENTNNCLIEVGPTGFYDFKVLVPQASWFFWHSKVRFTFPENFAMTFLELQVLLKEGDLSQTSSLINRFMQDEVMKTRRIIERSLKDILPSDSSIVPLRDNFSEIPLTSELIAAIMDNSDTLLDINSEVLEEYLKLSDLIFRLDDNPYMNATCITHKDHYHLSVRRHRGDEIFISRDDTGEFKDPESQKLIREIISKAKTPKEIQKELRRKIDTEATLKAQELVCKLGLIYNATGPYMKL